MRTLKPLAFLASTLSLIFTLSTGVAAESGSHQKTASNSHGSGSVKSRVFGDNVGGHGAGHDVHWSYSGAGGPENWGRLKRDYKVCRTGTMQSPIDFDEQLRASLATINFGYKSVPLQILNNGHTVQANIAGGSSITVDGKTYDLLQFHFHTPSEHTLDGEHFQLEMHLVHKSADGHLAVVGVFFKEGSRNDAMSRIWDHLPHEAGDPETFQGVKISAADLLPGDQRYFRYMGSLTTPPCSEGVNWHVMREPLEASSAQIEAIARIMGANARPVQAVKNRLVLKGQ